jgi:hypothetical protein
MASQVTIVVVVGLLTFVLIAASALSLYHYCVLVFYMTRMDTRRMRRLRFGGGGGGSVDRCGGSVDMSHVPQVFVVVRAPDDAVCLGTAGNCTYDRL